MWVLQEYSGEDRNSVKIWTCTQTTAGLRFCVLIFFTLFWVELWSLLCNDVHLCFQEMGRILGAHEDRCHSDRVIIEQAYDVKT